MSGEQKASHIRGGPFPLASDFPDEEESPPKPMTLNRLGRMMAEGFNHMNGRIDENAKTTAKALDALAVRVVKVEAAAAWKDKILWAVRKGWPFALAVLAHYAPDLYKLALKLPVAP